MNLYLISGFMLETYWKYKFNFMLNVKTDKDQVWKNEFTKIFILVFRNKTLTPHIGIF